jgi:serine/threonine protein kinase
MTCPFCGAEVGNAIICPQCGATVATPSISVSLSLPLGTKLFGGKYSVGKVLGQGGFGITYMGADNLLSRPVAIKELFPEGCQRNGTTVQPTRITPSDFASMKQRFLEEARLLASLNHPGIVKVYDFFEENNTAYMVMEYLRGKSLAKLVEERGGALGEQEAVGYILKVCEALDVVHKAGYLHRDIKPENIIVCGDGRVVLIDFGAARAYMAGKTGRMTVILTPGFAPYEQYATMARFGPTLDIYALGATLYYLLTGRVPVSAPDRVIGVELKGVREINGRVSRQVEEAVMKAMAMKVDERPQSVEEFVKLLTSPSVPSVVKGEWREVATLRHGDWVWSVSFSPDGKFLASGSNDKTVKVWEVGSWREVITLSEHEGAVKSVAFSPDGKLLAAGYGSTVKIWEVGSCREVTTLHQRRVHSVTFSPDGKFLAAGNKYITYRIDDWSKVTMWVTVWEVGSWQEIAYLKGTEYNVLSVAFSPDGKFLASGNDCRTVKVCEVGSWGIVAILRGHEGDVWSVAFSPDGKFLASGSGDRTVKVWEVGSWQEVTTLRGHGNEVNSVAFSPDGKFLASGSDDKTVKIWEVESWQEVTTLWGHRGDVTSVAFSPDGKFLASGSTDSRVVVWKVE